MPLLGLMLAVGTAGMTMGIDLAGSEWRPSFVIDAVIPSGVHMSVEFKPDGALSGDGGCNRFFGSYSISGNRIKIGPIASTRIGCPGLLELETAFFATLEAAKSFEMDGTTLVLFNGAGTKLAAFARAAEP